MRSVQNELFCQEMQRRNRAFGACEKNRKNTRRLFCLIVLGLMMFTGALLFEQGRGHKAVFSSLTSAATPQRVVTTASHVTKDEGLAFVGRPVATYDHLLVFRYRVTDESIGLLSRVSLVVTSSFVENTAELGSRHAVSTWSMPNTLAADAMGIVQASFDWTAQDFAGQDVTLQLQGFTQQGKKVQSALHVYHVPARAFRLPIAQQLIKLRNDLLRKGAADYPKFRDGAEVLLTAMQRAQVDNWAIVMTLNTALERIKTEQSNKSTFEIAQMLWDASVDLEDAHRNVIRTVQGTIPVWQNGTLPPWIDGSPVR